MNKKTLIGSLLAVAILITVSFAGVVGYQATESSTISKESPLFNIRSSRAIDEDGKDFTCNYVGKGEEVTIQLPVRNNKEELLEKIKDRISKMDEEELNHLKNLIIHKLGNIDAIGKIDISDGNAEPLYSVLPITICDRITVSYPIICFLDDLYDFFSTLLVVLLFGVGMLFLIVYVLVNGGLPPTVLQYPPTIECCQ